MSTLQPRDWRQVHHWRPRTRFAQAAPQTWLAAFLFTLKWLSVAGVVSLFLWHTSLPSGPNDPWSLAAQDFAMTAFTASYFYLLTAGALIAGGLVQLLKYSQRTAAVWTIAFALFALIVGVVLIFGVMPPDHYEMPRLLDVACSLKTL